MSATPLISLFANRSPRVILCTGFWLLTFIVLMLHHHYDDDISIPIKHRAKRFIIVGHRWPVSNLTYKISIYPSRFRDKEKRIDRIFELSFDKWARESRLVFRKVGKEQNANIDIRFVRDKDKGFLDPATNGGNYGAIALPINLSKKLTNITNQGLYFNDYVDWSIKREPEENKPSLLIHASREIGHSLGMGDSLNKRAMMYPNREHNIYLHDDDIQGIRRLYSVSPLKKFYLLENRWFEDNELKLYDKSANSAEECADYAVKTRYNITVFNRVTKKCSVKRNNNDDLKVFYRNTGVGIIAQGSDSYDIATSTSTDEVEKWIKSDKCDTIGIHRGADGLSFHYGCKRFKADDCCSILFRLDEVGFKDHLLQSLVADPLNRA